MIIVAPAGSFKLFHYIGRTIRYVLTIVKRGIQIQWLDYQNISRQIYLSPVQKKVNRTSVLIQFIGTSVPQSITCSHNHSAVFNPSDTTMIITVISFLQNTFDNSIFLISR